MSEKKKSCVMEEPDRIGAKVIKISTNNVSINNLTDENIIKILQFLTIKDRIKLEAVCKKWQEASKSSWRDTVSLDFSDLSFLINHLNIPTLELDQSIVEKVLFRCGKYLKNLNFGIYCGYGVLSTITQYCPNLTTLSLGIKNNPDEFPESLPTMEKLKSIKVRHCCHYDYYEFLQILPAGIEKIAFVGECKEYDPSLANFTDPVMGLQKSISDFEAVQSLEFEGFEFREFPIYPALKHLSLIACQFERDLLIGKLDNIEYLNLRDTYTLNENLIFYLTDNCKNLKYLDISGWETGESLSTESLKTLGTLESLEKLFLNCIYYAVDNSVINCLNNNLKILECKSCDRVTDSSIIKVLKNFENLERLVVAGTRVTMKTLKVANRITQCGRQLELHVDYDVVRDQRIPSSKRSPFLNVFLHERGHMPQLWDDDDDDDEDIETASDDEDDDEDGDDDEYSD